MASPAVGDDNRKRDAGFLSLANRGKSETRWDETRGGGGRGRRDEWEHVSKGCFCTAEVLTQLHERLLAPLLRASVLLLCPSRPSQPLPSSPFLSSPLWPSLILRRRHRRHPPFPRPHEPTLARTLSLSVFHPLVLLLLLPSPSSSRRTLLSPSSHSSPRTSFRIIFILSSAILVNAIPPVVREPFFILRLNILSRYRAVETSRLEDVVAWRKGEEGGGRHPGTRWRSTLLPCDKDPLGLAFEPARRGMSSSELRRDSLARYLLSQTHVPFILF